MATTIPTAPDLIDPADYDAVNEGIFTKVKNALETSFPQENTRYRFLLQDLQYKGDGKATVEQERKARMGESTLGRDLTGRISIVDKETGAEVSKSARRTLMQVPYFTKSGLVVRNGTAYAVPRQLRLVPGAYPRDTADGGSEIHYNVAPKTGPSFRMFAEPETGRIMFRINRRQIPAYSLLSQMGVPDAMLQQAWGKELFDVNKKARPHPHAIHWMQETDQYHRDLMPDTDPRKMLPGSGILQFFERMRFDPQSTSLSVNRPFDRLTPTDLIANSQYLLSLSRKEAPAVDRDSLAYQEIYDLGDMLAHRIAGDREGIFKQLMWKVTNKNGDAKAIPTRPLQKYITGFFNSSGVAQPIDEINPFEAYDQNHRVIRFGEGALTSIDAAPRNTRGVQHSYAGFIDGIRAPESIKVGLDMYLTQRARIGSDKQIYAPMVDPTTGQETWIGAKHAANSVIGFPSMLKNTDAFVPAIVKSREILYMPREEVNYIIPTGDDMFSTGANTVAAKGGVKGMRLLLGAKYAKHALPIVGRMSPLVDSRGASGKPLSEEMGEWMGAVRAKVSGTVSKITKDALFVQTPEGAEEKYPLLTNSPMSDVSEQGMAHELQHNLPFSRKTFLHNTPTVKVGDPVTKGGLLATSNFTDDKGNAALGTQARIAYMPYYGYPFEDAVVISESFAKRLESPVMYASKIEKESLIARDKNKYMTLFPRRYTQDQFAKLDKDGFVKPGQKVSFGDPLVIGVKVRDPSRSTMGRRLHTDSSIVWEHHAEGEVTDVVDTPSGKSVYVRTIAPLGDADKIAIPWGNKGVTARIVPDNEMLRSADGTPIDLIMGAQSISTRTNPSQLPAAALGKVAKLTGKPYVVDGFTPDSWIRYVRGELAKNNLADVETVHNPITGRDVPEVFVGDTYVYRLQQTAEKGGNARSTGGYTADGTPMRGGSDSAKHWGDMEYHSLRAHDANDIIKELKFVHGQQNDDFWRTLRTGGTPTFPKTSFTYQKFRDLMKGAGVEVTESTEADSIFSMTSKQSKDLTGGRLVASPKTYDNKWRPFSGGLFDENVFGRQGNLFGYIPLPEPMLNPVMYEPVRAILGKTNAEMDEIVQADGPKGLVAQLEGISLPRVIKEARETIRSGPPSRRDAALTRYRYARAMERQGTSPKDFLMDRVPVLPPRYRQIIATDSMVLVPDMNRMYRSLYHTINDFNKAKTEAPEILPEARKLVYDTYRAVIGTVEPPQPKLQKQEVGGILKQLFGTGSPKRSFVQRRVVGSDVDVSGKGVIIPDPSLKLNEVGIPEEQAWKLFQPFIMRHMVQNGYPALRAQEDIKKRTDTARAAMYEVASHRPVLVNRAPTLHKYSIMAFNPKIVPGNAVRINPMIVVPFNADFDGDKMSYMMPIGKKAVEEARAKMFPENNLISMRTGKVHYVPRQEYAQGLFIATKDPKNNAPTRKYSSVEEAKRAYWRGEIAVDDPVSIG